MTEPRVLLLGDSLAVGGTEGQFVEIASRLSRDRWDVRVACLRAEGTLRARLDAAGVGITSVAGGSARTFTGVAGILRLARRLRHDRVVLVHAFDYYSNVRAVLAARLARIRVIASQRDLGNLRPPRQERLQRTALRLADGILVNSPAVAGVVRAIAGIRPERIALVPNGVDLARFAPGSQVRAGGPIVVGTLANLRPEKGVIELVRAATFLRERCPETRVVLWGEGPLRDDITRLVTTLGLLGTVTLAGRTTAPEAALRSLDVFVLASTSEANSNAVLEAMASGLPIVATDVGGNPWVVEDERTGLLVPPGDPAALAKALIRLVEDPIWAARLGRAGRERVEADFGLDRLLARLEALYRDVLSRRLVG